MQKSDNTDFGTFTNPNEATKKFYKWREEFSKRLAEELKKYSDEDLHNMHIECCFGDPTAYALADMIQDELRRRIHEQTMSDM
jgi:hypothetical protein